MFTASKMELLLSHQYPSLFQLMIVCEMMHKGDLRQHLKSFRPILRCVNVACTSYYLYSHNVI